LQLSVVICSHNPREDYLSRTLESLKAQTLPLSDWELLLVDNCSREHLSKSWNLSWHPLARHVREDELGLTAARVRALQEASGDQILFFDDDNVVEHQYLERALQICAKFPFLGAFGAGALRPEFEVAPSPKVTMLLPLLALRTVPSALWSNNAKHHDTVPWGAGLCVRREVASCYAQAVANMRANRFLGPCGQRLSRGDDDLFSLAAAHEGWGFGVFPQLEIAHLIPEMRVKPAYLVRLVHDHRLSHTVLNYSLYGTLPSNRERSERLMKIALRGLLGRIFRMRCQWSARKGERSALRLIHEHDIKPLHQPFGSPTRKSFARLPIPTA
jgi:glycosyltransferase involved in cell wall biosynthesis